VPSRTEKEGIKRCLELFPLLHVTWYSQLLFMARCLINPTFLIIREFQLPAQKAGNIAYSCGSWQQSAELQPTAAAGLGGGREKIYKKGRKRKGK
jgi:hypothetical protein